MLRRFLQLIRPSNRATSESPAHQQTEIQECETTVSEEDLPTPKSLPNAPRPVTRFESAMPLLPSPSRPDNDSPAISIVLIVYKMPEQAKKTIYSLCSQYQRGVNDSDYEIIVVENNSSDVLGETAATSYGNNIRYFLRDETEPTPVHAINFGVEQARANTLSIMIDGARMVTPGLINYALVAMQLAPKVVISVPGYHLGEKLQQEAMLEGYDETLEHSLLESIEWPKDGYRLFDIACLSGTSAGGFFKPIGESNCLFLDKDTYDQIGGCDPRFNESGGGQVNLDLYKRACELPDTVLVVLPGEASFHQFHGGVTTGQKGSVRRQAMEAHFAQYAAIRGEPYSPPEKRAIYLGSVPDSALRFIRHGANRVITINNLQE